LSIAQLFNIFNKIKNKSTIFLNWRSEECNFTYKKDVIGRISILYLKYEAKDISRLKEKTCTLLVKGLI